MSNFREQIGNILRAMLANIEEAELEADNDVDSIEPRELMRLFEELEEQASEAISLAEKLEEAMESGDETDDDDTDTEEVDTAQEQP